MTMWWHVALIATLLSSSAAQPSCSVFDPFKVLPDNNKFQIGGAFPLHDVDCSRLRPDCVQEVVAIQWALTHWNQNPANFNAKLGLYAGDTCSRPREALSQSLRFLDSVGFHEPEECRSNTPAPKLLGLIAPKDVNSSLALGTVLSVSAIPVASYSTPSVNTLVELELENLISTAPTLGVYLDVLVRLVGSLHSNLVAVVDDGQGSDSTKRLVDGLRSNDVYVSEVLSSEAISLGSTLEDSDAKIIIVLLNKKQLNRLMSSESVTSMDKLIIWIPSEGEALEEEEQLSLLPQDSKIQVILVQQRFKELPQFRDYFLRVLRNNFRSYQLLTSYVQQVYNCSTAEDCPVDKNVMIKEYVQSRTTEGAIRMTYAFAAVGKRIGEDSRREKVCQHPSPECTALIIDELLSMDYEFGVNDPSEFAGEHLRFYRGSRDGVLQASGLIIDALRLTDGVVQKIMTFTTGSPPTVVSSPLKPEDVSLRSLCSPFRPFCGQCSSMQTVSSERHFLSIPRHYPMYLLGLFDLHSGPACRSMAGTDVSLPMAFIHTVWTFKQRFPQLSLLANLELGALIVDSCSSGRQAVETVVRAESQCFRFSQAARNITIVPGSVFGYVSGLGGESEQGLRGFFSAADSEPALVSAAADSASSRIYSATPAARNQALALLRLLNRMKWQFVTVALSEQDPESLALFHQFERLALDRGVCLAEVVSIGGSRVENLPVATSTNVTVVFATARDAAVYLSLTLRGARRVHVMMGDAHDWHLHEENHQAFLGTVSVQPKDIVYADFKEWLETTTPLTLPELWFWAYIEDTWKCALSQKSKLVYGKMCSGDELLNVASLGRMTKAGYLARGLERLLFAMDFVYKKLCPQQTGLCIEFYEKGRQEVSKQLLKSTVEDDVSIYEFVAEGEGAPGYRTIGNWSLSAGLRMHSVYRAYPPHSPTPQSLCHPPMCRCFLDGDFLQRPLDTFVFPTNEEPAEVSAQGSYVRRTPAFGATPVAYKSVFEHLSSGQWRHEPYNLVLLALITALTVLTLAVLALVLVKLYLRVVRGNQSLGISLLVGIAMLYATAYFFVFDPTDMVCRMRIGLHGFGYAVCFGVIIAKATQLRNAETLGFGTAVHISYWNYWLLLFFIVGVQIALSSRWASDPTFLSAVDGESKMRCTFDSNEFVASNIYVVILLFLAFFLTARNRNIKRNYKETKWLFVASVVSTVIWLVWPIVYLNVPAEWKSLVVIAELLTCATVLLAFLFGPKIYILLSYEPVVVEYKQEQPPTNAVNLFEREDDVYSARAVSPASSDSGHRTGSIASRGDEHPPIFHTVMRKKKLRRSRSEHELQQMGALPSPGLPVIRSPVRNDAGSGRH